MRGDVQKQVGDQLNGITESAFFFFHSKECAATGNSRAHIKSASSKGIDKVLQKGGRDVCSTTPS